MLQMISTWWAIAELEPSPLQRACKLKGGRATPDKLVTHLCARQDFLIRARHHGGVNRRVPGRIDVHDRLVGTGEHWIYICTGFRAVNERLVDVSRL